MSSPKFCQAITCGKKATKFDVTINPRTGESTGKLYFCDEHASRNAYPLEAEGLEKLMDE